MKLFRFIALLLIVVLVLPFVACDNDNGIETVVETQSATEEETTAEIKTEDQLEFASETLTDAVTETETVTETITKTETTTETSTETETTTKTSTETETETETESETTVMDLVDFVVSVEEGREPVILHITDTQIIDATQERAGDPVFGSTMKPFWGPDKLEDRCFKQLRETINATKPDLIIFTGDLVYGKWDDNGSCFLALVEFMESFNIPWAPVFGNHDNECRLGVDWQCEQLENAENCLFLQRNLTGNGNYTVGIEQGGELKRVFYMLDSNGCGGASDASMANGHTRKSAGFGNDQMQWCTRSMREIKKASPETKISAAFHIQLSIFSSAFAKYGYVQGGDRINIDKLEERKDGDLGYIGAGIKSAIDADNRVWNAFVKNGVDSIFVGHEHSNSASIVYEGVRMQYGQKSSEYDRYNFVDKYGEITTAQIDNGKTSLVGGTVFTLAEDGTINTPSIYYAGFENGEIDWEKDFEKHVDVPVNGLQFGTDLTLATSTTVSAEVVWVDDEQTVTAYKFTASYQGKVYVNTELVKNKSTVTFSLYVPSTSTGKFAGHAEFAVRIKPNEIEPGNDGLNPGHIMYKSTNTNEEYKVFFDEWRTYTVDISGFGEACTEFAFYVPTGNTVYIKDILIE